MGIADLIGNKKNQLITRLTDSELEHFKECKQRMKKETGKEPSDASIIRLAVLEFLERRSTSKKSKK